MPYHLSDDGPPSTRYRQYVRARLFRTHAGLSVRGIVGIVILVVFAIVAIVSPHHTKDAVDQTSRPASAIHVLGGPAGESSR
jgi:hypothetical protein